MAKGSMLELFANDPCARYYNLSGLSSVALTADIDWAPEYAVEDMLGVFEEFGFKISVFATHASNLLATAPDWVEVGLHPDNTRPHPETGLRNKITDLLELFPKARGVRAHRNFFGQNIAQLAAQAGLLYDASVLQWRRPFCQAFQDQYGLVRMSYIWEDGINADMGLPWSLDEVPLSAPGLQILNFHPIFLYLNCPDDDYRRKIVGAYPDLTKAPLSELRPNIYDGYGARSFLRDLLTELRSRKVQSLQLSEIAQACKAGSRVQD